MIWCEPTGHWMSVCHSPVMMGYNSFVLIAIFPAGGLLVAETITPVSLAQETEERYLTYAMSVITSRAAAGCP
jgi:hypothetical protein